MQIRVWTHIQNIPLFNSSEPIVVTPVPNGAFDVEISVRLDKVLFNSNSSALYLQRNYRIDRIRRWWRKRKAKKNVQSKRNKKTTH